MRNRLANTESVLRLSGCLDRKANAWYRNGLKRENLRDHMSDLELIFSIFGEAAGIEVTNVEYSQGFNENKKVYKCSV